MKKIIFILTFLAFLSFAKTQTLKKLRMGFIFSNAVLFNSSDNIDIKNIPSYDFDYGINIDYFFTKSYVISTGVYIDNTFIIRENGLANNIGIDSIYLASDFAIKKGLNHSTIHNSENITGMYLNLPISIKLKTREMGYFKYFGDMGILNSFRLQSRYTLKDTDIQKIRFGKYENTELPGLKYYTSLYNFSLKVGDGFEYTISDRTAFMVAIYFYNGFVNFIEDNDKKGSYIRKLSLRTGVLF